MQKQSKLIRNMVYCAIFTVLITVGAYIRIPIPGVPFTLQFLFVMLAGLMLEATFAFLSVMLYIFIGLLGLPVFTQGGGFAYVLQPTFGYLLGFAVAALVVGLIRKRINMRGRLLTKSAPRTLKQHPDNTMPLVRSDAEPLTNLSSSKKTLFLQYFCLSLLGIVIMYICGVTYMYFIARHYLHFNHDIRYLLMVGVVLQLPGDLALAVVSAYIANRTNPLISRI